MAVHIGCYVKCNFEKIKTTRKEYGCPGHGIYSNNSFVYCYRCGRKLETIEEVCEYYPSIHRIIGEYSGLGAVQSDGKLYIVSCYNDGTNFNNQDGEIALDMTVMANAMLAFHRMYKVELEKIRNYGPIEIHFGVLFLDEV